jgi:LAO/AO transport system kinase
VKGVIAIIHELIAAFDRGDPVALGRLLKEVENQTDLGNEIIRHTLSKHGHAHVIGITGPPGVGKSTVTAKLCKLASGQGFNVGVVCIDPTSPFTGGALLGDRIRMLELTKLPNMFIKSLATRGSLGGLVTTAADVVQIMDAFGKDFIIVETVGVGQVEFDVMDIADTIVLVTVPKLGDAIQALKAGIMEVADIYIVNQADRPGADDSSRDLKRMVDESREKKWQRPVIQTVAVEGKGVDKLLDALLRHREYLLQEGLWQKNRVFRNGKRLQRKIQQILLEEVAQYITRHEEVALAVRRVEEGLADPYKVAEEITKAILKD